jgi:RHS repeat-associated protein
LANREKRVDDVGRERGGWFHYLNDPIGTPDKLLAEDGSVATEYERKAWGQLEARSGAKATTPIRLQGQYWDEETGLAYNRWRYYDGEGRFVSADPIGLAADHHVFRWSKNAIARLDPTGLASHSPGVYTVHYEAFVPPAMYAASDGAHFREANRQLHGEFSRNPSFRACMEQKYPGIAAHVAPGPRGGISDRAPPGTTWHHHPAVPGLLQLVDRADHNSRHNDHHPGGIGGRNTWGGGTSAR